MKNNNITYTTKEISKFYSRSRISWDELYPSEKYIFEKVSGEMGGLGSLLDVGCACGGLGLALQTRFKLNRYTGIDINKEAIQTAREIKDQLKIPNDFFCGDILDLSDLPGKPFQTVVSLGCADWNGKISFRHRG